MRRKFTRYAAPLVLGSLLGLCVLEASLQIAPMVLPALGDSPAAWLGLTRRVLCLGDSDTYGVWLADRGQTYPAQLERLWNAANGAVRIEVLNLGYPGTNSSQTRRYLAAMLETFRPDVVIVQVGNNDDWTAPVAVDETPPRRGAIELFKRYSRTYRLVSLLQRALDHRQIEIERDVKRDGGMIGAVRYGDVEFPMGFTRAARRSDNIERLLEDLRAIAATIREANAEPLLMTYSSRAGNRGEASQFIRVVALETGTRLIDLASTFTVLCPTEPCPRWFYRDHHPTAHGFERIGAILVEELQDVF
jgi:lysophospholipase L1-like esterase